MSNNVIYVIYAKEKPFSIEEFKNKPNWYLIKSTSYNLDIVYDNTFIFKDLTLFKFKNNKETETDEYPDLKKEILHFLKLK